jgi:hypothetical protein
VEMLCVQRDRRAVSAVLTTIVILVASMVMGSGVVVYSTSLFQTGGQQQSAQIQGLKTWANATYSSGTGGPGTGIGWGAFAIKNTGDKLLSVNSIMLRGAAVPFTNWYVDSDTSRVGENFQAQFNYTQNDVAGNLKGSVATGVPLGPIAGAVPSGGCVQDNTNIPPKMIVIQEGSPTTTSPLCLVQQNGPISLSPGASAVIYYKLPLGLITPTDSGVTSTTSILAGNAAVSQTVRIGNP